MQKFYFHAKIVFFLSTTFLLYYVAYRILAPQQRIEPRSLAVRASSPNHWTAWEFPVQSLMKQFVLNLFLLLIEFFPFCWQKEYIYPFKSWDGVCSFHVSPPSSLSCLITPNMLAILMELLYDQLDSPCFSDCMPWDMRS